MGMDKESRGHLFRLARDYDHQQATAHAILTGQYEIPDYDMALPPREYQKTAGALAHNVKGLLLADELGLGKTISGLVLLSNPNTLPALVVCPTHLPKQWQREVTRFLPKLTTHIVKKGTPYEIGTPDVVIINYHKLSGWAETLAPYVTTVIYDEVQDLRRSESAKYSAAHHISVGTDYRLGLSATPIYNYGGEFFNVMDALAPGSLGKHDEFMREWCTGSYNPKKARINDPKAFGTYLRETGRMLRRTKGEVGRELPSLNKVVQEIDSDPGTLKKVESAATELANFIVKANENRSKGFDVMRASQEFSNTLRQATGIAKAPFVAEFVRMLYGATGEKVVLFGWHREVYSIWEEKLRNLKPAWYTGSESVVKKDKEIQRFIQDPNCKVLMMSLRSGSGVDGLQDVCSRVIIGELDWSPGAIEQCVGRVHRDGQKEPVFAYYPISRDGVDPIMVDVLGLKRSQLEGVKNPDGVLIKKSQVDPDHVKKLAEDYLSRKSPSGRGRG